VLFDFFLIIIKYESNDILQIIIVHVICGGRTNEVLRTVRGVQSGRAGHIPMFGVCNESYAVWTRNRHDVTFVPEFERKVCIGCVPAQLSPTSVFHPEKLGVQSLSDHFRNIVVSLGHEQ
jgi:hypothetical protein